MRKSTVHSQRPSTSSSSGADARGVWLTRIAFILSAGLILARATMLETLRNPLEINPGSEPVPHGPGPGEGLLLDLLCCLPAMLVLARRAFDPSYVLRFAWSFVPMALLAAWVVASTLWAGDKFAALVSGLHWLAACVFLWSAAQLVADWMRLRLVAAVCVGLLLVQAGQGLYYRYVEHPELVAAWQKERDEILRQRGWEPGSFAARQFENRIVSGEIMGFTSSPNSYAALLVLLTFVAAGMAIQRLADGDEPAWVAVPAVAAGLGALVIVFVGSRTALATPLAGGAILAGVWLLRGWLPRHARLAYALGLGAVALATVAVVGHGLYHGTLFHDSLTFRWRYWVAAARMVAAHPFTGVGWENFGPHYLAARLPIAAEEIKDPHNFVMRFATELGGVGLVLLLAWLLRLAWELTRPVTPAIPQPVQDVGWDPPSAPPALGTVAAIGITGILLNVLCSIDWSQPAAYNALELMRRLGFLCLFLVGAAPAALRSAERQEPDDRPAPWVLYAILAGLALFLLHNLVDFSLFEPGPLLLFTFLCGSALGVRMPEPVVRRDHRFAVVIALAAAAVVWLIVSGGLAAPVVTAEHYADDGDEALRNHRFGQAASQYERALAAVPYNADYAFRAARATLSDSRPGQDAAPAVRMLDRAIALDPNRPQYWLHRAFGRLRLPNPDAAAVRSDYEQALRLDPNNVDVRLEYGDILRRFGDRPGAAAQYRESLRYNDLLHPDEPKRLPASRVNEVTRAVEALSKPG
jgi:O-antigen ligase/tetratricopeptide (TPR) repeat protein